MDDSTGIHRLLDTGSQISITCKGPEDKIDHSLKLVAVNGSKIDTFGIKTIEVKIGRKAYPIPAVVCDIQQDILGMDFIKKFRLNFEWDEFTQSELFIVDRKAQIKKELKIITVPTDIPRVHYLDSLGSKPSEELPVPQDELMVHRRRLVDNDTVQFEVACMEELEMSEEKESKVKKKLSIEEQLLLHEERYVQMIQAHPQLLNPSFTKGEPAHGIYHRIDTPPDQPPCKAKRRPIIMNSAKAARQLGNKWRGTELLNE